MIESRDNVPFEIEQMRRIVAQLQYCSIPVPIQAIFCDSRACADFTITLGSVDMPLEFAALLVEQAVFGVVGGYNGLLIKCQHGTEIFCVTGNWLADWLAAETH